jgi:hypothetical protein
MFDLSGLGSSKIFGSPNVDSVQKSESDAMVWTSVMIDEYKEAFEFGEKLYKESPFFENDTEFRAPNVTFRYTKDEIYHIKQCIADPVHFADNFAYSKTNAGIDLLELRDYQYEILNHFMTNRRAMLSIGRQSGKTVTSAIYMAWYATFHTDKNILIVANKEETALEIMEKFLLVIQHLPFYLKPGIVSKTVKNVKLDNGTKIQAKATTFSTGRGNTIDLLYCDEFAFIPAHIIDGFFQSIYPTLEANPKSQFIITSTPPRQPNKYTELWTQAVKQSNEFRALHIDWSRVPGRDEEWRQKTIDTVGEDVFLQEYACEFVFGNNALLPASIIKHIYENRVEFKPDDAYWDAFEGIDTLKPKHVIWDQDYINNHFDPDSDHVVLGIDLSHGIGGDYSVVQCFKLIPLDEPIMKSKKNYNSEDDFFGLRQIGMIRTNTTSVSDMAEAVKRLAFDCFNPDLVAICLETNTESGHFMEIFSQHPLFDEEMFVKTRHRIDDKTLKLGIRYTHTSKMDMLMKAKRIFTDRRIQIFDQFSVEEFAQFALNSKGSSYSAIQGHDDCVMSAITASAYLGSTQFTDAVDDTIESIPAKLYSIIEEKMIEKESRDERYATYFE